METVLITGASSGIGYELAKIYAENRYNLVITARRRGNLENLRKEIQEKADSDVKVTVIEKDLSMNNAAKELYDEIKSRNIEVDILINNAGIGIFKEFLEYSGSDVERNDRLINLNIKAVVEMTKLFLDDMMRKGKVQIMNVASIAAFQPGPLMSTYYASKAFVLSFTEAVKEEVSVKMRKDGLTAREISEKLKISVLCPGPTDTEFEKSSNLDESSLFSRMKTMKAEKVAQAAFKKFRKGKTVIITGQLNKIAVFGVKFLPRSWVVKMAGKLQEKKK